MKKYSIKSEFPLSSNSSTAVTSSTAGRAGLNPQFVPGMDPQERIAELETKNAEIETKNAELETKNAEIETRNTSLQTQLAELKSQLEIESAKRLQLLESYNESLISERDSWKFTSGAHVCTVNTLKEEIQTQKEEIRKLKDENSQLKSQQLIGSTLSSPTYNRLLSDLQPSSPDPEPTRAAGARSSEAGVDRKSSNDRLATKRKLSGGPTNNN